MPIYTDVISLSGSPVADDSAMPVLRDMGDSKNFEVSEDVLRKNPTIGTHTNFRILPYTMQNNYKRDTATISIKTIVYENSHLKAIFLPEYGGRLYSLFHKKHQRELLYVNPVFQPANLAIRNAWFSGGIEWNVGHFGHSCLTCTPVFFGLCINEKKEPFLRLYEYERMQSLFYQIDFYMPEDSDVLATYTRIINPYDQKKPLYYWANVAVHEHKHARVFSEENDVIYIFLLTKENGQRMHLCDYGRLPHLDETAHDASYPQSFSRANEYFYQNNDTLQFPWEAVGYDDGFVLYEYSSQPLRYRKMFCWGQHRGGRKWQSYLSHGIGGKYLEIQAGIAPTQLQTDEIAGRSCIEFMQVFGGQYVDDANALYDTFENSKKYIKDHIFSRNTTERISQLQNVLEAQSHTPVNKVVNRGLGWGHLEYLRTQVEGKSFEIKTMYFCQQSLDERQSFWQILLHYVHDVRKLALNMPELCIDSSTISYMTDPGWKKYLECALKYDPKNEEWYRFHLGILYYENAEVEKSLEILEHQVSEKSAAMRLRTIGFIYNKLHKISTALFYYEMAYKNRYKIKHDNSIKDFLCEYFQLLYDAGQYTTLWKYYQTMVRNDETVSEEMQVVAAKCAFALQEWEALEGFFQMNLERIREGENVLCELWFQKKARDVEALNIDEVRKTHTPPENIDFRML